ncbi:Protein son of sevenless-like Protein [Caligus rogercresseyi]|uniref:Protein son of sevenless-like Protein n=1 Tax=Caligus rogercresseyi TaxID=217165 RepID=A0A7T8K827_CALRO|nr:Protein son of sevenless-like Protein [Caligus rogercresseyi]
MSVVRGDEESNYDWRVNSGKWRGLFSGSLSRVLYQVHPSLMAQTEALDYVEGLILRLLAMLTSKPTPLSVSDVSDRVSRTFPTPLTILVNKMDEGVSLFIVAVLEYISADILKSPCGVTVTSMQTRSK